MDGKTLVSLLFALLPTAAFAQGEPSADVALDDEAPVVTLLPQRHFPKTIPAGNYSGIAWLGGDRYAVVSDKSVEDGFFVFQIEVDSLTGEVRDARNLGFRSSGFPGRDDEGICFVPRAESIGGDEQWGTIFISGEDDNAIREYTFKGQCTGRELPLPSCYNNLPANLGLEALSYNSLTKTLWTCNESGDVYIHGWRLIDAKDSLNVEDTASAFMDVGTWLYQLDAPLHDQRKALMYAHGIGTVCALDDGSLLVLEREAYVPTKKLGASVTCKLFRVTPYLYNGARTGIIRDKQLLASWKTSLTLTSRSLANYEGMCLGPQLQDGSGVLVLVADSQDQYRGVLRDWIKTIRIFPPNALSNKK